MTDEKDSCEPLTLLMCKQFRLLRAYSVRKQCNDRFTGLQVAMNSPEVKTNSEPFVSGACVFESPQRGPCLSGGNAFVIASVARRSYINFTSIIKQFFHTFDNLLRTPVRVPLRGLCQSFASLNPHKGALSLQGCYSDSLLRTRILFRSLSFPVW